MQLEPWVSSRPHGWGAGAGPGCLPCCPLASPPSGSGYLWPGQPISASGANQAGFLLRPPTRLPAPAIPRHQPPPGPPPLPYRPLPDISGAGPPVSPGRAPGAPAAAQKLPSLPLLGLPHGRGQSAPRLSWWPPQEDDHKALLGGPLGQGAGSGQATSMSLAAAAPAVLVPTTTPCVATSVGTVTITSTGTVLLERAAAGLAAVTLLVLSLSLWVVLSPR